MPGDVGQWRGPPITAGPRRRSRSSRACRASSRRPLRSTGSAGSASSSGSCYLDNNNLFPLSLFLRNLIAGASTTTAESAAAVGTTSAIISPNIQAVTMILAIIPILFIYPFVQRHFVSGVMLGSVKG